MNSEFPYLLDCLSIFRNDKEKEKSENDDIVIWGLGNMHEIIQEILKILDCERFKETELAELIKDISKKRYNQNPPVETIWEQFAFSFKEKYSPNNCPWGTYFGSICVLSGREYPSIQDAF